MERPGGAELPDDPARQLGAWHAPAEPTAIPQLRRAVLESLAGLQVDTESVALAVSEAVTNVVRHAYPDGEGGVTVTASRTIDTVTVTVTDTGVGLTPDGPAGQRPARPPRVPGMGVGLGLIQAAADSVVINESDQGVTIDMTFRIRD
jgi:anti-sigma regulatory factor (Ser/Thr protein kinase)